MALLFVAALEPGRTSWTARLDAVRLCPWDGAIAVTAAQVREVFQRLYIASQSQIGDPPVLVVVDVGYDVTRLAFLLADLPVELPGRMRSDHVLHFAPRRSRRASGYASPSAGRSSRSRLRPLSLSRPSQRSDTTHYGKAVATAWDRLHPLLVRRSAWAGSV
ncbi:transposase [Streptomyces sp. NPDC057474]|uniref:transposase n=1 Tax=Streptomyces sp. NPDC057474 TaxID=3346144 RepID=UPI0036A4183F